jgi:anti-sigma factor RsiW
MTSVQATYRARPATSELIDLTRPNEPGLVRRYGWAVALVVAGAGLLGFVIAGLTEPGYTATAYVELSPETPAEAAAVRDLLRSQDVRSAVATELGASLARLRPISVVDGRGPGSVGVQVSGRNRDRVQTIAVVAARAATDARNQQASVAHAAVTGGVRRLGLEPARTSVVAAGTGLVLSLCVLFVLTYFGLLDRRPVVVPSPYLAAGTAPLEQP